MQTLVDPKEKGSSDDWLLGAFIRYGSKEQFVLLIEDLIHEYPDIRLLIEQAKGHRFEAWPNRGAKITKCTECNGVGKDELGVGCTKCAGFGSYQESGSDNNDSINIRLTAATLQELKIAAKMQRHSLYQQREKLRSLCRTERGSAIENAQPEAVVSDVRGIIEVMKRGGISREEWKGRQMWLKYWLLRRYPDIPEALRCEAEFYRDLPYQPPKRKPKKATTT